eukprot:TRINITY_DN138_c0_g2_i1.p1 TRINITY_DN138_c0_g2~~TRINITY_DN138_c0_g2_i1.p1  ORF type:complete len:274 (+),score=36.56 TRINITY_DN138_c0_g2_i1:132-953(+)
MLAHSDWISSPEPLVYFSLKLKQKKGSTSLDCTYQCVSKYFGLKDFGQTDRRTFTKFYTFARYATNGILYLIKQPTLLFDGRFISKGQIRVPRPNSSVGSGTLRSFKTKSELCAAYEFLTKELDKTSKHLPILYEPDSRTTKDVLTKIDVATPCLETDANLVQFSITDQAVDDLKDCGGGNDIESWGFGEKEAILYNIDLNLPIQTVEQEIKKLEKNMNIGTDLALELRNDQPSTRHYHSSLIAAFEDNLEQVTSGAWRVDYDVNVAWKQAVV